MRCCSSCPNKLSINKKDNLHGLCISCYLKSDIKKILGKKGAASRRSYAGAENPRFKGGLISKVCQCGKGFKVYPARIDTAKFCSRPCKHKYSVSIAKSTIYAGVTFRSRWEAAFAAHLDENNLSWKYEPESIPLEKGWYVPDFWVPEWSSYVEVKGFWRDDAKLKFDEASKKIPLKLVNKQWFLDEGYTVSCKKGVYK